MADSMKRPAPRMRVYGAGLARNGQSAKAESDHFVSACVLADHAKKNGIGRVFKCPGGTAVTNLPWNYWLFFALQRGLSGHHITG